MTDKMPGQVAYMRPEETQEGEDRARAAWANLLTFLTIGLVLASPPILWLLWSYAFGWRS